MIINQSYISTSLLVINPQATAILAIVILFLLILSFTLSGSEVALRRFGYQGRGMEISTTAEGLLAMQVCGQYNSEEVRIANRLFKDGIRQNERWFFYATYYYAQGMYQRGGSYADEGARLVPELLLPLQSREGWWEGFNGEERQGGRVYATSMAILSLGEKPFPSDLPAVSRSWGSAWGRQHVEACFQPLHPHAHTKPLSACASISG